MAAGLSVFSCHNYHSNVCFDPLMDYAQVLAEAQKHQNQGAGEIQGTCLSPARSSKESSSSKRGKSWKSSLCFWRRPWTKKQKQKQASCASSNSNSNSNSGNGAMTIPAAKQQSFKYRGGRSITMAEAQCYRPGSRAASKSGPLAAMLGAAVNRETPYLALPHCHSSVVRSPIYLIT